MQKARTAHGDSILIMQYDLAGKLPMDKPVTMEDAKYVETQVNGLSPFYKPKGEVARARAGGPLPHDGSGEPWGTGVHLGAALGGKSAES